jgi:type I restriction enzyme, S subunit
MTIPDKPNSLLPKYRLTQKGKECAGGGGRMMKGWGKARISEYINIVPGYAFSSSDFKDSGVPIIKIANVKIGFVDLADSSTQYVEPHFVNTLNKKYHIFNGDILISLTGSHLTQPNSVVGRVGRYRYQYTALVNQRAAKLESRKGKSDKDFIYHLISTPTLRKEIALLAQGAANQANVSHKDIEKIKVFWPPLPIQRKIAAVLSAYDDLIENNNRRIAILEKMAEELYREWFVRLRFPGHEKVKIVKGVPEGWEIKKIGEVCNKVTDGAHASPSFVEDGKFMASVKDMTDFGFDIESMKTIGEPDFIKLVQSDCKPLKDDILIAKDGSYLKHVFVWDQALDLVILSSIAILRPNKSIIQPYFFSLTLKQESVKSMMSAYVSGSALPRIILNDFKKMQLLIPKMTLMLHFESTVRPIYQQIRNALDSVVYLKSARDRLLTRLMSGKIDVADLDIRFPASMKEEKGVARV